MTEFLEQGDDGHGGKCMHMVYSTKNYNELVDYLFEIGEEWRFEVQDEREIELEKREKGG